MTSEQKLLAANTAVTSLFKVRLAVQDALNFSLFLKKMTHVSIWRNRTFVFPWEKKRGGGVSVTGAALNTGREEQISWNEIRSLSGHRFRQVNSSSGDIYHQTYCFAATGGGAGGVGGEWVRYHKRHHTTN